MADYNINLKQYLTSIADAIREKTGQSEKINAKDFAEKIMSITAGEGGVDTSDATALAENILEGMVAYIKDGRVIGTMPNNGAINETMDGINTNSIVIKEGYTSGGTVALDNTIDNEVNIQADIILQLLKDIEKLPEAENIMILQTKNITENGTYIPDDGYDGFSSVTVKVENGATGEKPTLFPPSVSLQSVTSELTITDDNNGAFVEGYDLYIDGEFIAHLVNKEETLTDYTNITKTVEIKVKATSINFNSSDFSNIVEWIYYNPDGTIGLAYSISSDGTYAICKGIGEAIETDIKIAFLYEGVLVNHIDERAFYGCGSLTSVTIPDSVTFIGNNAFYGCNALKYNEKYELKYLGNDNNKYLCLVDTVSTYITTANIDSNCKIIGYGAFSNCKSLTSIEIPDSVTSINSAAFIYCSSLTSVTIPDSVTSIGEDVFFGCRSLTSVTIPDSVTSIGETAFYDCSSLRRVDFSNHTSVPKLSNTNAFANTHAELQIKVPSSLINEWKEATNWANYADKIVIEFTNEV